MVEGARKDAMITDKIINLFFPTKCSICGKLGTVICKDCENILNEFKINLLQKDVIELNHENDENDEENKNKTKNKRLIINKFYIYKYDGIIRNLLIKYKFNDASYLRELFAKLILKNKKVYRFLKNYDIIIPVPISKKRKLERGYNQTELILKFIEKELKKLKEKSKRDLKINKQMQKRYLNIQLNTESLIKIKNTKPQSKSNLKERINNVKGVYKLINEDKIKGKRIVIFDDIYTTGSTINECINCIKNIIINNSSGKEKIEIGTIEIGVLIIAKDYMEVI